MRCEKKTAQGIFEVFSSVGRAKVFCDFCFFYLCENQMSGTNLNFKLLLCVYLFVFVCFQERVIYRRFFSVM